MPIYDFKCQECGQVSEVLVRDASQDVRCSRCGGDKLMKMVSAPHMIRASSQTQGTTCCGRAERCETPPCSTGGGCQRH